MIEQRRVHFEDLALTNLGGQYRLPTGEIAVPDVRTLVEWDKAGYETHDM